MTVVTALTPSRGAVAEEMLPSDQRLSILNEWRLIQDAVY